MFKRGLCLFNQPEINKPFNKDSIWYHGLISSTTVDQGNITLE
jgi:hypothetical protein